MNAGRRQIEQGRDPQHVSMGLVCLENGRVSKTPHIPVQRTIELVFEQFAALGSCQKVMWSLRDEDILLPRLQRGGPYAGQLIWRKPTQAAALVRACTTQRMQETRIYGRKGLHPDLATWTDAALSGLHWKSGQPSIMGCILHISPGTNFWPIKRAWEPLPVISRADPTEQNEQGSALLAG